MKRLAFISLLFLTGFAQTASADSAGPELNPTRAYPPSCVALPLPPPAGNEPVWSTRVNVPTIDSSYSFVGSESVTYLLWRTPCNGGTAAMIGQMQRDNDKLNDTPFPVFAQLTASQGTAQNVTLRPALDPNTVRSGLDLGLIPVPSNVRFVLEEAYDSANIYLLDYTQPMNLTINGSSAVTIGIPQYNPNLYATAGLPLQISGYQTGNYADPSGGQGIQVEVAESATDNERFLVLAWYTYDASHTSYWLFNSTSFPVGARSAAFPLGYYGGGGFAGGSGTVSAAVWGNISVSFPDCDHMVMTYGSAAGLPSGVPTGSGTRTFTRVTNINGVTCDHL
jgi:hypothetical protein